MVVDDEAVARVSLAEILRLEEYQVSTAASGEEALSTLRKNGPFDLLVLDIKMPGMDGLAVTRAVRELFPGTAIILLTAFGTLETAIQAVQQGAHNYLLKPCPIPEILESVRTALTAHDREQQRSHLVSQLQEAISGLAGMEPAGATDEAVSLHSNHLIKVRDVMLDDQRHAVTVGRRPLDLTPTEFKVLACLMRTPDQVWSPQELIRRAQGYETDAWGARAIVRVHVRRLRKKMEPDPSHPRYILNVRGVGYLFASSPPEPD